MAERAQALRDAGIMVRSGVMADAPGAQSGYLRASGWDVRASS